LVFAVVLAACSKKGDSGRGDGGDKPSVISAMQSDAAVLSFRDASALSMKDAAAGPVLADAGWFVADGHVPSQFKGAADATTTERDAGTVAPVTDGGHARDASTGVCDAATCGSHAAVMQPGMPRSWRDPTSGLVWSNPPATADVPGALAYCESLTLDGHTDWRLPTITQLRTLVRGCPDTMPGGMCKVSETCTDLNSCYGGCLQGCESLKGPGPGGCYWDAGLGTEYCGSYWSATPRTDYANANWDLNFTVGDVMWMFSYVDAVSVRCVREAG
jgi:hypothetical protein